MGSATVIRGENYFEATLQSRPSQNHASPNKAEKSALLQMLEQCESTIKLHIYTDSKNTIKSQEEISMARSQRDVIKIDDYPIVEKINFEMKRFLSPPIIQWVKSHDANPHNIKADELAKLARENYEIPISDITPYKTGISLERDFHIFNTRPIIPERLDCYPRLYFKTQLQQALTRSNTNRIIRHWAVDFPNLQINYPATTKALSIVLSRSNYLDASNHRVHAFRINCLNRSLQTLDLLTSYNFWKREGELCVICEEFLENRDHIWTCPRVKTGFIFLSQNTTIYVTAEVKAYCELKGLPFNEFTKDCLYEVIDHFFRDYNPETFMPSPAARGIITNTALIETSELVASLILNNPTDKFHFKSSPWLLSVMTASWTRSLYDFYWRPRTRQIFKENEMTKRQLDLDAQKEKLQLKTKRKREKQERQRASIVLLIEARRARVSRPRTPNPTSNPNRPRVAPKDQHTPGRESRQHKKKRRTESQPQFQPTTPTKPRTAPTTRSGIELKNLRSPRHLGSPNNRKKPKRDSAISDITASSVQSRIIAELDSISRSFVPLHTIDLEDNPFHDNFPKKPPDKQET